MAARIICGCGTRDHVTPLRKELHWLPIEARPMFKIPCYTYKQWRSEVRGSCPGRRSEGGAKILPKNFQKFIYGEILRNLKE